MNNEKPLSENMRRMETDDFYLTLGLWRGHGCESYEIGIRRKDNGNFQLMQGWNNYNSCNLLIKAHGLEERR